MMDLETILCRCKLFYLNSLDAIRVLCLVPIDPILTCPSDVVIRNRDRIDPPMFVIICICIKTVLSRLNWVSLSFPSADFMHYIFVTVTLKAVVRHYHDRFRLWAIQDIVLERH